MNGKAIVLVIEDEPVTRESFRQALEADGFVVRTAGELSHALTLLGQEPRPCCILLDLGLPDFDGREFLARRKQFPGLSSIPVVVVSAQPDAEADATRLGADMYLCKPTTADDLRAVMARYRTP